MVCKRHHLPSARSGLTLPELLVVIAILGALASGVVPSVRLLLRHAASEDAAERFQSSWKLALAMASVQQQAVMWSATVDEAAVHLSIEDAHAQVLWSSIVTAAHARILIGSPPSPQTQVRLAVFPHGLADPVAVEWEVDGQKHHVDLQEPAPVSAPASDSE